MSRVAVILFNLGGPDNPDAVKPFLRNLFSDPAIITAPAPVRWFLARLISSRRAQHARSIYAKIGGSSPSNCTSTTAPITCVTLPVAFFAIVRSNVATRTDVQAVILLLFVLSKPLAQR